jgi:hypothetical protein
MDLVDVLLRKAELGLDYKAAVLASLWPESIEKLITDRLGLDPATIWQEPVELALDRHRAFLGLTAAQAEDILARWPQLHTPLFVGGPALYRWGWSRQQEGMPIELQAQGRITREQISWWFTRIRAFGFGRHRGVQGAVPDAVDRLVAETGGIPLLVKLFDEQLLQACQAEGGIDVSADAFLRSQQRYHEKLSDCIRALGGEQHSQRLSRRERELLGMVVTAVTGPYGSDTNLWDLLTECWEVEEHVRSWQENVPAWPLPAPWSKTAQDQSALAVLTGFGLLPALPEAGAEHRAPPALDREDLLIRFIWPTLVKLGPGE